MWTSGHGMGRVGEGGGMGTDFRRTPTYPIDVPDRRTRPTNDIETVRGGSWAKGEGGRERRVVGWVR